MKFLGSIIGIIIAIILILYHLFQPGPHILSVTDRLRAAILIVTAGAVSGFIVENYFIYKLIYRNKYLSVFKTGSIAGCIIGSILFSPYALFVGIVFGMAVGGGWAAALTSKIGLGEVGAMIGVPIGIILFIVIVECVGAVIGTISGYLTEGLVRWIKKGLTR